MVALLWCLKYEGHCLKCYTHTNDLGNGVTDEESRRNESELPFIECDVYSMCHYQTIVLLNESNKTDAYFKRQSCASFTKIPIGQELGCRNIFSAEARLNITDCYCLNDLCNIQPITERQYYITRQYREKNSATFGAIVTLLMGIIFVLVGAIYKFRRIPHTDNDGSTTLDLEPTPSAPMLLPINE